MVIHLVPHGQALLQELAAALAVHQDTPVHEVCLAVGLKKLAQVMEQPCGGCEDGLLLPLARTVSWMGGALRQWSGRPHLLQKVLSLGWGFWFYLPSRLTACGRFLTMLSAILHLHAQ